jgi:phytoene dehydrogenase-like protein
VAPPGRHAVILQKVLEMDHWRSADWDAHKAEVEDFVVGHLERVLPGVRDRIVVRLSATARTASRFTLNHSGAMLGWEMSPEQLDDGRPGILGPVSGLYLVGHWTRPGGGITPVIVSALHAAEAVLGRQCAAPVFAPREATA